MLTIWTLGLSGIALYNVTPAAHSPSVSEQRGMLSLARSGQS